MNGFTVIFLLMLLFSAGLLVWLARRQRDGALCQRHAVPEAFRDRIGLADHQKSADYTAARMGLEQVDTVAGAVLTLIWTLGGGLNFLAGLWAGSGWGPVAAGTGLIISALLITSLLEMPLDVYRTFGIEARFGFNRTTPALYVADLVKHGLVFLLLGTPLIALLLWLVDHAGRGWWLYAWLVWMGFSIALLWLYPTLIAPLFNRFSPLEDEALRTRILRLLERCGFTSGGIFVMDGSKRSGHGNAYFTGFGANKRIVFFDTLLKSLDPDEVEAVLAHELGHFKHGHVRQRLAVMAVLSLAGFALLGYLVNAEWFYHGLGVQQPTYAAAFILFAMVLPYFTTALRPLSSYWARRHEFEADDFAAAQTDARHLIRALVKLYEENASILTPDRLYSAYHDSHPPAPVRIAHLTDKAAAAAP
jgi:STE24 endopeptidase